MLVSPFLLRLCTGGALYDSIGIYNTHSEKQSFVKFSVAAYTQLVPRGFAEARRHQIAIGVALDAADAGFTLTRIHVFIMRVNVP